MSHIVNIYPTMAALLEQVGKARPFHAERDSFGGWMTTPQACEYVSNGATPKECEATKELLSQINDEVSHRPKMQHIAGPTGSRVIVGEVIAGVPYPMRRRKLVEHDLAPVRIVCEALVSHGVSEKLLAKRGAALAALAMRLSETRAVELWAAWAARVEWQEYNKFTRNKINVFGRVKLDNNPLTVAEVVAVLATPQFARNVMQAECKRQAECRDYDRWNWAWGKMPQDRGRQELVRETLNLEPQDIFIPGGHLTEREEWAKDPIAWVEKYVADQREQEYEE